MGMKEIALLYSQATTVIAVDDRLTLTTRGLERLIVR
jgi:hypothetical protein